MYAYGRRQKCCLKHIVDWNWDNKSSVCKNPLKTDASIWKLRMLVEEQVDCAVILWMCRCSKFHILVQGAEFLNPQPYAQNPKR